jgi:hypothetical protein
MGINSDSRVEERASGATDLRADPNGPERGDDFATAWVAVVPSLEAGDWQCRLKS